MPGFVRPLFGDLPLSMPVLLGLVVAALMGLALAWQILGLGPRRRRGLKRAQRRLQEGAWSDALERVRKLRARKLHARGSPSAVWRKRFNQFEADCLLAASRAFLQDRNYERALEHLSGAAQLREQPDIEARLTVQAAMLEEVRKLFAAQPSHDSLALTPRPSPATGNPSNDAIHDLIGRILRIQAPCREASFWQGLCFLREHDPDRAMTALQAARTGDDTAFIDPPLYLGALLLGQGKAKEALRHLTEANRIDANCPLVTLQLGSAILVAGGDTNLAVRALQRSLGTKGLPSWDGNPRQGWVEAFPEGRSYVRKLAGVHSFTCPLWGGDFTLLIRQGQLALAQGHYKLGNFREAADLYGKAIKEGAPSLPVIRGLGLSLARLGQYDEAFKHLRIAHEMEDPKDRLTAGYLALCGARGTPTRPEDKARNIAWAITLVTQFTAPGDKEWAALINVLFGEARAEIIPLSLDDQLYLCEHLWSVHESDLLAAQAFHHLMANHPRAVRPEYAWLYCRAAQQHHAGGEHAVELFALTFASRVSAEEFFTQQRWDFGEIEYVYLERAAALASGRFPEALGPDYPARGESLLVARSLEEEKAGRLEAALAAANVLAKLAPANAQALDRLAALSYRQGQADQAVATLESWHDAHPGDPLPLVRFAVLLHERGLLEESQNKLREAMALAQGVVRGRIAFLAARLTLQSLLSRADEEKEVDAGNLKAAQQFLEDCLHDQPVHADAQWLLAAVRWLRGDEAGLANQLAALDNEAVRDPRFHFMAALARWSSGDFAGSLDAAGRSLACAESDERVHWPSENAFLIGLARLGLETPRAAAQSLERTAKSQESPSARHAQALLGRLEFEHGHFEEASRWWQLLDAKTRAAWKLAEPLAGANFLSALEALQLGRFEEAAEKFRAAGRLGMRDRRLGGLLVLSLFKAGQKAVYGAL
ncbi:MAG: tetratricopeptide repeat protein [Planctomycetes bacterium]|nr:tetratricopeptide repeat protein [Planctomycetota bacterium]